jgi:hypothetical protein
MRISFSSRKQRTQSDRIDETIAKMVNDPSPNRTVFDASVENQPSGCNDEPWSQKSIHELERDADQILEDIRNVVLKEECSTSETISDQRAVKSLLEAQEEISFHIADRTSGSLVAALECPTSPPPTLIEETSQIADNNAGDMDDDSLRGELDRLDSVADAIRLSLEGKSFANLIHDGTSSPLFSQATAGNDFASPSSPSTTKTQVVLTQHSGDDTSKPHAVDSVMFALFITFLLIASLWLLILYTMMIVLSQCEILDGDGMVRWPTCSSRFVE